MLLIVAYFFFGSTPLRNKVRFKYAKTGFTSSTRKITHMSKYTTPLTAVIMQNFGKVLKKELFAARSGTNLVII